MSVTYARIRFRMGDHWRHDMSLAFRDREDCAQYVESYRGRAVSAELLAWDVPPDAPRVADKSEIRARLGL